MEKIKILYIEDEIYAMKSRIQMLKDNNYDIKTAGDVDSALKELEGKYDLILLDIMMPYGEFDKEETKGGYETGVLLIKKIKESNNKDTPIIIITANPSSNLKRKIEKLGVASYLTKPIHQIELEEEIKLALERKKS